MTGLGKADWLYDTELGVHIPTCSQTRLWSRKTQFMLAPCHKGPLTTEEEIAKGECADCAAEGVVARAEAREAASQETMMMIPVAPVAPAPDAEVPE